AFDHAIRLGAIVHSPMSAVQRIRGGRRKTVALTPDQVDRLRQVIAAWQAADPRRSRSLAYVIDFQLGTGVRISEALALRWGDLDLESDPATARVRATVVHLPGAGLQRQGARKGRGADDEGIELTLPGWLRQRLIELHDTADEVGPDAPVFPARGSGFASPHNIRRSLRDAIADTEFEGWFTTHVLRKTVATRVEEAMGLRAASAQLGHSDAAVT